MMACSVTPDRYVFEAKTSSGLVKGHAYSLTKVLKAEVDTGRKTGLFPLIRIRNPWGNDTEWKGAWSDGSVEWRWDFTAFIKGVLYYVVHTKYIYTTYTTYTYLAYSIMIHHD